VETGIVCIGCAFCRTVNLADELVARNEAGSVCQTSLTLTQHNSPLLSLNWAPILENMGTTLNPTYQISSVYGWREGASNPLHLHPGIDIVARVGHTEGRSVHTPFLGTVRHVYTNPNGSAGYGIVVRYRDANLPSDFFVRYLHLQSLPARADGTPLNANISITRGEQVGRVGATPPGMSAHLHMDVHRDADPTIGVIWGSSIDPRAFFVHGFVAPWPGLSIQN